MDREALAQSSSTRGFHAVVQCTKARALRDAVRQVWDLPPDADLRYTGPQWLQILLSSVDDSTRTRLLLLFWRCWHLRNDIIHAKGDASISQSASFIVAYAESLFIIRQDEKGKAHALAGLSSPRPVVQRPAWAPPPVGWAKLNTAVSFDPQTGNSFVGCIARNCNGEVLLSAWDRLARCSSATEAEAEAFLFS